jgi:tetratricopeptide (TPR) repeat protein/DNA-binding XRE family transcriptional regulator
MGQYHYFVRKRDKTIGMESSHFDSFGTLLKGFRVRRHLTQQQLADKLGVRRNTIGTWERGDFLPGSKGVVLELARCLYLQDQEMRQLQEASLIAFSPYLLVPFPRNPFFTGREEILETLHAQLVVEQAGALTRSSVLHGLGGVGKTQIALEYAYRYSQEYRAIFWIEAETAETVVSSLLHVAEVLQLPERDNKDQQQVITDVQRWLTTHGQWLLIWDNLEDLDLLSHFLPPSRQGSVLLTTRTPTVGTLAWGIDLAPMNQEEGTLLLLRRGKVLGSEANSAQMRQRAERLPAEAMAADKLVRVLGGLPLALDQAGAYIEETGCTISRYLEHYMGQHIRLLDRRGGPGVEHPQSVMATFRLSMERVERGHRAAADMLCVCALLHADAIPEEVFVGGAAHLGAELAGMEVDSGQFDQAITVLQGLSLVQRHTETRTFSLHRLVQAVLLDTMTETERELWAGRSIEALAVVFPDWVPTTPYATWKQSERLLSHVLLCLNRAGPGEETLAFASLAYKVAQYLRERGAYGEAEPLLQRALRIREQVLGTDHPDVARTLNYLANVYWQQSKYGKAEPLLQRALRIREQVLGPNHPEVANTLHNLATLFLAQGNYGAAEPLYQQALRIVEQSLGPNHLNVASTLHNLASLFLTRGSYVAAEPLYQQALRIVEQSLGPNHPEVAHPLNGLAENFLAQGNYEAAEPLYQRALRIREQALGPDHSEVAHPLNGLANLSREQGNYAQAERLYQRALSIREHRLSKHHPDTAQIWYDLAILRQKQGNLSEALSLTERALQTLAQFLGETHPKMVAARAFLAQLRQEQRMTTDGPSPEQRV